MGLAFDVSSGSGLDYASTIELLSQAYVGNTKGLKQLNLGLTQAEIKAMSFDDVMALLNERFAGSGAAAINTYVGQMDLLKVASSNASEIIGVSLLGAIDSLTGSDGISAVGTDIENAAKSLGNFIDSIVYLKEQIATIPGAGIVKGVFGFASKVLGNFSPQMAAELLKEIKGPQPFSQPMSLANQDTGRAALAAQKAAEAAAIKRNKELAKLAAAQAKSAAATLKAKQEQAKLDKATAAAQLALGKGTDVFDMDKIQINAALIGQAEALGKATTSSQLLAIANDVQRLKVKQSINELEDAIASKDVARIERATKQLNEDLKILGTLQSQNITLLSIQTILNNLKPKDLINLENLYEAIRLLGLMTIPGLAGPSMGGVAASGIPVGDYVAPVSMKDALAASTDALLEYADAATERANAFADLLDQQNEADAAALEIYMAKLGLTKDTTSPLESFRNKEAASNVTVTIVDKTSGLIEVVQTAVQQNNRYGNNLNYAGALPV
jgi:hypothetical protein